MTRCARTARSTCRCYRCCDEPLVCTCDEPAPPVRDGWLFIPDECGRCRRPVLDIPRPR